MFKNWFWKEISKLLSIEIDDFFALIFNFLPTEGSENADFNVSRFLRSVPIFSIWKIINFQCRIKNLGHWIFEEKKSNFYSKSAKSNGRRNESFLCRKFRSLMQRMLIADLAFQLLNLKKKWLTFQNDGRYGRRRFETKTKRGGHFF